MGRSLSMVSSGARAARTLRSSGVRGLRSARRWSSAAAYVCPCPLLSRRAGDSSASCAGKFWPGSRARLNSAWSSSSLPNLRTATTLPPSRSSAVYVNTLILIERATARLSHDRLVFGHSQAFPAFRANGHVLPTGEGRTTHRRSILFRAPWIWAQAGQPRVTVATALRRLSCCARSGSRAGSPPRGMPCRRTRS